jgi:hypothetical protein
MNPMKLMREARSAPSALACDGIPAHPNLGTKALMVYLL